MKTFVLSDESLNSQGFRVLTSGIDLTQFEKNPVMLYAHDDEILPIGRWRNVRKEGDRLLAEAEFDEGDELAQQISAKVEKGYINCCSIGFKVTSTTDNPYFMLPGQKWDTVSECVLLECSICAVGSNYNAMRLYDERGRRMELSDENMMRLSHTKFNIKKTTMTEEEINALRANIETYKAELEKLSADFKKLRAELETKKAELETKKAEVEQLRAERHAREEREIEEALSAAVNDGRIQRGDLERWHKLMELDRESTMTVLASLNSRTSISALLKGGAQGDEYAGKSWEELDKSGKLSAFKDRDPEGFRELYKSTFGVEYRG